MPNKDTPAALHEGHRARMQQRVRENGLESLHEHEALEYLLYFAFARKNTNPLAHALIQHFGSFCRVLEASEEELLAVEGIGPSSARLIHSVLEFSRYYSVHKRPKGKPVKTFEEAVEYVRPLFLGFQDEHFYLIAMNDDYKPIRDVLIAKGLPNKVAFDAHALARTAVATGCTRALLAHNHPAGLVNPSQADLQATNLVVSVLTPLGITVEDHIIVSPTDACSIKAIRRLPFLGTETAKSDY